MQWAAPEYRSEQGNPVPEPANGKITTALPEGGETGHPASQMAFEKQWQQRGESGLAALRAQLLKREEELRRKEQEDTNVVARSSSGK